MRRAILASVLLASLVLMGATHSPAEPDPAPVVGHPSWDCPDPVVRFHLTSAAWSSGVPVWIFARLVSAESGYQIDLVGVNVDGTRDLGIAQLNSRYLGAFADYFNGGRVFDPFDPAQALPIAARYLADLYHATGDWSRALAAYNCGLSRVLKGQIPERTKAYVAKVMGEA